MQRGSWVGLAGLAVVSAATFVGCDGPTSISVFITSDKPCSALKGVRIEAGAPNAPPKSETTTQCRTENGTTVIGTMVLVPSAAEDAEVLVRVVGGVDADVASCTDASKFEGCIVARRRLRFVPGKEIDLPIALRDSCKSVACEQASTCVAGVCTSAIVNDPARCSGNVCDENGISFSGSAPRPTSDGGAPVVLPDGGLGCGSGEKLCNGKCVSAADPAYGCTRGGCSPCAGVDVADFACSVDKCVLLKCKDGLKACGDACVPLDPAHGCGELKCEPCVTANGTATCSAAGTCNVTCAINYKLCGGKCVSIDDPTYGCSLTGCTDESCPVPGVNGAALVCVRKDTSGGTCTIGECPAGTKICNQKCVPTDANNGCELASRCTACATGEVCQGAPTTCTCVAEPITITCQTTPCGAKKNNCGTQVDCGKCAAGNVCVTGPTTFCCTPSPQCVSVLCGTAVSDGCGGQYTCQPTDGCYADPGGSGGG